MSESDSEPEVITNAKSAVESRTLLKSIRDHTSTLKRQEKEKRRKLNERNKSQKVTVPVIEEIESETEE
jgi:hypothetical protein